MGVVKVLSDISYIRLQQQIQVFTGLKSTACQFTVDVAEIIGKAVNLCLESILLSRMLV